MTNAEWMNSELKKQFDSIMTCLSGMSEKDRKDLYRYMAIEINHRRYPDQYESRKKLPCSCGARQLHAVGSRNSYYVWCPRCHKYGPLEKTELEATRAWNRMMSGDFDEKKMFKVLVRYEGSEYTGLTRYAYSREAAEKFVESISWSFNKPHTTIIEPEELS